MANLRISLQRTGTEWPNASSPDQVVAEINEDAMVHDVILTFASMLQTWGYHRSCILMALDPELASHWTGGGPDEQEQAGD